MHQLKYDHSATHTKQRHDNNNFKGVLHLLPKISMFCALSQNNQELFEK